MGAIVWARGTDDAPGRQGHLAGSSCRAGQFGMLPNEQRVDGSVRFLNRLWRLVQDLTGSLFDEIKVHHRSTQYLSNFNIYRCLGNLVFYDWIF